MPSARRACTDRLDGAPPAGLDGAAEIDIVAEVSVNRHRSDRLGEEIALACAYRRFDGGTLAPEMSNTAPLLTTTVTPGAARSSRRAGPRRSEARDMRVGTKVPADIERAVSGPIE